MIKLEYLATLRDLQVNINGHRIVMHPNRMTGENDEIELPQSDYSEQPVLVQNICAAMWALPEHTASCQQITFLPAGVINVDGRVITPDSDISNEPAEVQAFFNAVYPSEDAPAMRLFRITQEEKVNA